MKPNELLSFFTRYLKSLEIAKNYKTLILAWGIPLIALGLLFLPEKNTLKAWDQNISPWLMFAAFLLALMGMPKLLQKIAQAKDSIFTLQNKNQWLLPVFLVGLMVSSSILALNHIDAAHRVQSDESIFLATAQNIYNEQVAGTCDEGYFDQDLKLNCLSTATSFKTKILSTFYAVGMPIFGKDLRWIFGFQFALYLLMGITGFIGIQLWLKQPLLSLLSVALLLYTPTILFQYRSASVEPLYIVLAFFALIQLYFLWDKESKKITQIEWISFAAVLAMLAQTRQESLFCLGAFLVVSLPKLLKTKTAPLVFYHSLFALMLPVFFLILSYRGYGFQGGEFEAHGINNFIQHIQINFREMTKEVGSNGLLQNPFLSWFTWMSLFGFVLIIAQAFFSKTALGVVCFLGLYHLQSAAIFENVSGDFTIHINQRYALVILPTMAFLGAWLLQQIVQLLSRLYETKNTWITFTIPALIGLGLIAWGSWKHVPSFEANIMYNRNHLTTEERTIHKWINENPGRKLWVYDRPWHFIGYGESALSYQRWQGLGLDRQREMSKEYEGEVYYVRGLRCYDKKSYHRKAVENRAPQWCENFERQNSLVRVLDTNVTNSYPLQISKIMVGENPNARKPYINIDYKVKADSLFIFPVLNPLWQGQNKLYLNGLAHQINPQITPIGMALKPGLNEVEWDFIFSGDSIQWNIDVYSHNENRKSLTELIPKASKQSWSDLKTNRSVNNNPLKVADQVFEKGLGTHAASYIQYELPSGFKRFEFGMGLDDEDTGGDGVIFSVRGDGREIFKSYYVEPRQRHWQSIDISGVKVLELIVDSLANKDYDHADWLEPTLVK